MEILGWSCCDKNFFAKLGQLDSLWLNFKRKTDAFDQQLLNTGAADTGTRVTFICLCVYMSIHVHTYAYKYVLNTLCEMR